MATRVNTRFVVGLVAVLGAMVLGMVAFWVVFVQRDPAELMHRGDALMAQGQPVEALSYYGPALQQQRTNLELIDRYLDALTAAPVDDRLTAEQYLGQIREWKRRAAELRPDDHGRLAAFYALERRLAERFGGGEAYNRLHELAQTRLNAEPDHPVARKYRGIAGVHRLTADAGRQTRDQVREDLERAAEHLADDAEVLHYLARLHLHEADRAARDADHQRAAELRDEALALSRRMLDADADDPVRQLKHLRVLADPTIDDRDAAQPLAAALGDGLVRAPTRGPASAIEPHQWTRTLLALTELMPRIDREPVDDPDATVAAHGVRLNHGVLAAHEMLEAVHDAASLDAALLARLGRLRAIVGDRDGAVDAFEAARRQSHAQPAIEYIELRHARLESTVQLADLLLTRADQTRDAGTRQRLLDRAAALVAELDEAAPDLSHLAMLRGKLALLQGEISQAAVHLDRAIAQTDAPAPSLLVLSATAHQRLGNWGTAADRYETLLQRRPDLTSARRELARIFLDGGRARAAQRHVEILRYQQPDDPATWQLHVRLLAHLGELDEALERYHALDADARSALLRPIVEAQVAAGRRDDALALVDQRLEEDPGDLRAVDLLIRLDPDAARERDVLGHARARGANPSVVRLLHQQLDQGRETAAGTLMRELVEDHGDALQRALFEVQVARREGDEPALRAALDRAAAAAPDDPRVIELHFELALHDADWSEAERIAGRAAELGLDQANGAFYWGRLAAARGDLAEATSHYRRGLAARSVYAEGWRRFGDVLVQREDHTAAADAYRRAVDQQPDNLAARRGLAAVYDRQGEHDRALEQLRAAVEHRPDDAALLEQYARYEHAHGQPTRALAARQRLANTQPQQADNRRALVELLAAAGRGDDALDTAQQLVADHGATRNNIATLAAAHRATGDPAAGERAIRRYIARLGDDAVAEDLALLAHFRLGLGDGHGALEAYRDAMGREDPEERPITRELAQLLFSRGMYAQAARLYARLHEADPDDATTAQRYGEVLVRAGRLDDAQQVLDALDDAGATLALRGLLAGRRGELDDAVTLLTRAIDRDGDAASASVHFERARLHAARGELGPAVADLEAALRRDPGLLAAHELLGDIHAHRGDTAEAVRAYRAIVDRAPANRNARLRLAELYLNSQQRDHALRLLQQSAEQFPHDPIWPRQLGTIALREGELAAAAAQFQRAVELGATAQDIAQLATLRLELDEPEAAYELLREHVEHTQRHPALQARRARALAAMGQEDAAARVFERALGQCQHPQQMMDVAGQMARAKGVDAALAHLDTSESGPALWRELAAGNLELGSGAREAAIERLEPWSSYADEADGPTQWAYFSLLARSHHGLGSHSRAAAAYERLLDLRPDDLVTLNDFAYMLADALGDAERALALAQRAAAQAPRNARVLDTLGWAQYGAGQLEAAQRTLERALALEPLPEAHLHLGAVHAALGSEDEARRHFERAVELAEAAENQTVLAEAARRLEE